MTYRELANWILSLSASQQDCDVIIECGNDCYEGECYSAEPLICGDGHKHLDENHPVLFVD